MYADRALLNPISNREDLVLTISLSDDDAGVGINLTGTTLANTSAPFTSNAWTVTDGLIATTSSTPITIPTFPVGNQLSALALTVAPGLGILPGDAIRIADTATGNNVMIGTVVSYGSNSGALVCQIGYTWQFEIRRAGPKNTGAGYISWWDFGVPDDLGPLVKAVLGGGPNVGTISIIDVGFVQVFIPEIIIKTLNPGVHKAAMNMTDGVNTRQLLIGQLPILAGGLTT